MWVAFSVYQQSVLAEICSVKKNIKVKSDYEIQTGWSKKEKMTCGKFFNLLKNSVDLVLTIGFQNI